MVGDVRERGERRSGRSARPSRADQRCRSGRPRSGLRTRTRRRSPGSRRRSLTASAPSAASPVGVAAVDVLPGARPSARRRAVRRPAGRELAPVVARAVGALDEQRRDAGRVGLGDDRRRSLPPSDVLTYQIHMPWPSNARARWRAGLIDRGVIFARRRVQRVVEDRDRAVRARCSGRLEQHHDPPRVRARRHRHDQAQAGLAQPRGAARRG